MIRRGSPPQRTTRPARTKRPRATNPGRKAREFIRCYGSKARVEWFKAQPCVVCVGLLPVLLHAPTNGRSHNAHTVGGGGSRKADANTIVPMCASHHGMYDRREGFLGNPELREVIKASAAKFDARWLSLCEEEAASIKSHSTDSSLIDGAGAE